MPYKVEVDGTVWFRSKDGQGNKVLQDFCSIGYFNRHFELMTYDINIEPTEHFDGELFTL